MKDATLGGYLHEHERPPAFEGCDGETYTVEVISGRTGPGDEGIWCAYLFFLRWQGNEVVDHVESGLLSQGASEGEVRAAVEKLTLYEVKAILDGLVSG